MSIRKRFLLVLVSFLSCPVLALPAPLFTDSGQALGDAFTWKALVGDIDNDGDDDIVSLEADFNRVQIYFNDGNGFFSFSSSKSFQRTSPHRSGALGDLNGDGNLDLVIGGDGGAAGVSIYSGDGTGGFTPTWSKTWSFAQINAVKVGDIDGNGALDLLAVGFISDEESIQACLNVAASTYTCSPVVSGISWATDAVLVDLDNDLDLDLAVASVSSRPGGTSSIQILLNNGGGFTSSGHSITAPYPYGLDAGDLDGDGDVDLAVGNQASTPNQILFNDGTGTFADSGQSLGAEATNSVIIGDIDLDGDLDLIAINEGHEGRGYVVYNNNGFGSFTEQEFGSNNFKNNGNLVDVDGDGDLDLVTGDYATGASNNHAPDQVLVNNLTRTDVDECTLGTHDCDVNATCSNTPGSFTCACNSGYSGDGVTCADDDECTLGTGNCGLDATCTNTPGSFACACDSGFSGDGITCTDIDECTLGTDTCDRNATCTNTLGGFTCACNAGYSGDGVTCTDIDECNLGTDNCDANATCTNTPGSFTCTCNAGYSGDATLTFLESGGQVVVEAETFTSRVDTSSHSWKIVPGEASGFPTQFSNYRGAGYIQVLPDVLLGTSLPLVGGGPKNPPNVDYKIRITTPGTYRLYVRWASHDDNSDSLYASIVELSDGTATNIAGAPITPTADFYRFVHFPDTQDFATTPWIAIAGFEQTNACCSSFEVDTVWTIAAAGDYTVRFGLREDGAAIDAFVLQLDTLAAPTLNGPPASDTIRDTLTDADGDGVICTDDDECTLGTDNCDTNATCTNTPGSFTCTCNSGYSGDGVTCADVDECLSNPCDANATCTNTPGSFTCTCNSGYTGDGFSCADVDECLSNPCDANATCTNTPGAFTCTCNSGYTGDGFSCADVDECLSSPCDVNATCTNTPGSFTCACNSGYQGDGFVCTLIDLCPGDPHKLDPGICGCGTADTDSDDDGTADCNDLCPNDPSKTSPGICECGVADTDTDHDGMADCNDVCPNDPHKTSPGICGCGTADTIGFVGFLPPIGGADATGGSFADPLRAFKLGSTIPVKFVGSQCGGPLLTGIHTLRVVKYSNAVDSDPPIDATPTDAATTGNQFRLTDGEWHFNLSTRSGFSQGTWKLIATLSDGSEHYVWITIKK